MFDQLKAAKDLLQGMDTKDLKSLMEKAQESKKMLEDTVRQMVDEEIKKRNLVSREEVERLIKGN